MVPTAGCKEQQRKGQKKEKRYPKNIEQKKKVTKMEREDKPTVKGKYSYPDKLGVADKSSQLRGVKICHGSAK